AVVRVSVFFFSSRRRHTRFSRDWSSDVCSSDLRARDVDDEGLGRIDEGARREIRAAFITGRDEEVERNAPRGDELGGNLPVPDRSEERRVGKECSSRLSQYTDRREKKRRPETRN